MELLLFVLLWTGIISQEQVPYISEGEAREMFLVNSGQIEAEFPDEYIIIMTDENEVN